MSKFDPFYVYIMGDGLAARKHEAAFEELSDIYCVVNNYEMADVIDLCTPTDTHLLLAHQALAQMKSVIIEKPVCKSMKEAVHLLQIEDRDFGDHQMVYPISQFSHTQVGVEDNIAVNFKRDENYYSTSKWRGTWGKAGGGVLLTHGWHVIQSVVSQIDADIVSVACDLRNMWHDIEVEDYALVHLTDSDGKTYIRQIATAPLDLGEIWHPPQVLGDSDALLVEQLASIVRDDDPYNMTDACWMMMLITACYYSDLTKRPVGMSEIYSDPQNHPFFSGWQQHFLQRQPQLVSSH